MDLSWSHYLRYGTYDETVTYNICTHFRDKPFFSWFIDKEGCIQKQVVNDYAINRKWGVEDRDQYYHEEYKWRKPNSSSYRYIDSDNIGRFVNKQVVSFIDDDKAAMELMDQCMKNRVFEKRKQLEKLEKQYSKIHSQMMVKILENQI